MNLRMILFSLALILMVTSPAEDGFIASAPVMPEEQRIVIAEYGLLFFVDTEFKFKIKRGK